MPSRLYIASLLLSKPNRFEWRATQDCRLDSLVVSDECCHDYDIREILVCGQNQILAPMPATMYANTLYSRGLGAHFNLPMTKGSLVEVVVNVADPGRRGRRAFQAALVVAMETPTVPGAR
jgi:hypothetical protein